MSSEYGVLPLFQVYTTCFVVYNRFGYPVTAVKGLKTSSFERDNKCHFSCQMREPGSPVSDGTSNGNAWASQEGELHWSLSPTCSHHCFTYLSLLCTVYWTHLLSTQISSGGYHWQLNVFLAAFVFVWILKVIRRGPRNSSVTSWSTAMSGSSSICIHDKMCNWIWLFCLARNDEILKKGDITSCTFHVHIHESSLVCLEWPKLAAVNS